MQGNIYGILRQKYVGDILRDQTTIYLDRDRTWFSNRNAIYCSFCRGHLQHLLNTHTHTYIQTGYTLRRCYIIHIHTLTHTQSYIPKRVWVRNFALGILRVGDSHCVMCSFGKVRHPYAGTHIFHTNTDRDLS